MTSADEDKHPVSSFLSVPGIDHNIIFKIIKTFLNYTYCTSSKTAHERNHGDTALKLPHCDYENYHSAFSVVNLHRPRSFALILWIDNCCHGTLINRIFTRIPFGIHFLLFEFGKFPSVVNYH